VILGLTGGIACGKSVAGATLAELGVPVLDADEVSHYLTKYDTGIIDAIATSFGREVFTVHGQIDRRLLGEKVFARPSERAKLEQILHPCIKGILANVIDHARKRNHNVVVVAPLLIEANFRDMVDVVWVVSSEECLQAERLRKQYGFSDIEAYRRINAQLPLREKEAYADCVLRNNGSLDEFRRLLIRTWEQTLKEFTRRKTPGARDRRDK